MVDDGSSTDSDTTSCCCEGWQAQECLSWAVSESHGMQTIWSLARCKINILRLRVNSDLQGSRKSWNRRKIYCLHNAQYSN